MADPVSDLTASITTKDILGAPRITHRLLRAVVQSPLSIAALIQRLARGFADDGLSPTRPAVFLRDSYLTTPKAIVEKFHRQHFIHDDERLASHISALGWGMCAGCAEPLYPTWYPTKENPWTFAQPCIPESLTERRFAGQVLPEALPGLRGGSLVGHHATCKPTLCPNCLAPIRTALELFVAMRNGRAVCDTCFAGLIISVQPPKLSITHRRHLSGRNLW